MKCLVMEELERKIYDLVDFNVERGEKEVLL